MDYEYQIVFGNISIKINRKSKGKIKRGRRLKWKYC